MRWRSSSAAPRAGCSTAPRLSTRKDRHARSLRPRSSRDAGDLGCAAQPPAARRRDRAAAPGLRLSPPRRASAPRRRSTSRGSSASSRRSRRRARSTSSATTGAAGSCVRLVSTRADLVRSWVCDAAGLGDVDFEWHDFAKIWQTPGEGEEFYRGQARAVPPTSGARSSRCSACRTTPRSRSGDARPDDGRLHPRRCTDRRVDVGKEWAPDFHDIAKPGRILIPSDDAFLSADLEPQQRRAHGRVGDRARRPRPLVDAAGPRARRRGARGVLGDRSATRPIEAERIDRYPKSNADGCPRAANRSRSRSPCGR